MWSFIAISQVALVTDTWVQNNLLAFIYYIASYALGISPFHLVINSLLTCPKFCPTDARMRLFPKEKTILFHNLCEPRCTLQIFMAWCCQTLCRYCSYLLENHSLGSADATYKEELWWQSPLQPSRCQCWRAVGSLGLLSCLIVSCIVGLQTGTTKLVNIMLQGEWLDYIWGLACFVCSCYKYSTLYEFGIIKRKSTSIRKIRGSNMCFLNTAILIGLDVHSLQIQI
jgi:hypothetical protein